MPIKTPNELYLNSIASTRAHFIYEGDYMPSMTKTFSKKRVLTDSLVKNMTERGFNVPNYGDPNPFRSVIKHQEYGVMLGSGFSYVKMQENKLKRATGEKSEYTPSWRTPHNFPIYKELLYLGMDLETLYIRVYPSNDGKEKPSAKWIVDGKPTSKFAIAPWAKSDDYKRWADLPPTEKSKFYNADGSLVTDGSGNDVELREMIECKIDNCELIINGENIIPKMFNLVSFFSTETLEKMRDEYIAKKQAEFEKLLKESQNK